MTPIRYSPYDDHLKKTFMISAAAHIAVFVIFAVRAAWVPSDQILIRNAIRVDMVALPDKVSAPAAPAVETPAPTPAPVQEAPKPELKKPDPVAVKKPTEKKPDIKKIEATQRKALEQLKAQDMIERMKNEVEGRETAKAKPKAPTFKGNAINQGDSLTGLEKIEFDRYFSDLEKQLKQHWNLPRWLLEANLRAQALVVIDNDGKVSKRSIFTSSGNSTFDDYVLDAIDKASFPPPPQRLQDVLAFRGVVFNFPN